MTVETITGNTLNRTSPSSLEAHKLCATKWFLHYKAKYQERGVPAAVIRAQEKGTAAHAELEAYLKEGKQPTNPLSLALMKYAPERLPGLIVEGATDGLCAAGVPIAGRIDWAHDYIPSRPIVADWKTRKDLSKYQKTEEELSKDWQMNCYARWAFTHWPKAESVDVAHLYVETMDTGEPPKTDRVLVNFTVDSQTEVWHSIENEVEKMKRTAATGLHRMNALDHPEDMTTWKSPCKAFGGCGYKYACPHSPVKRVSFTALGQAGTISMGLQALLDAEKAKKAALAGVVAKAEGIVPPDAGPRTNEVKVEVKPEPAPKPEVKPEVVQSTGVAATTEHVHSYGPDRSCACGAKKRGRLSAAEQAAKVESGELTLDGKGSPVPGLPDNAAGTILEYKGTAPSMLFVNAASSLGANDLTSYVAESVNAVQKAAGVDDLRLADKTSPLAYGGWKGALTVYVKQNPPKGSRWSINTKGDELSDVVAAALSTMAVETIRGS